MKLLKQKEDLRKFGYFGNDYNVKEGFLKIDMHVHTNHSDGMSDVSSILKKARKKGIGIAITDHNTIDGVIEAYKIKEKNDLIIPGIELHSKAGPHFLFYFDNVKELKMFYKKKVLPFKKEGSLYKSNLTIEMIEKLALKATVSIAHPEAPLWANIDNMIKKHKIKTKIFRNVHASEIMCGQLSRKINIKGMHFAKKYKLSVTGGSDAHSSIEVGTVLTVAKADDIKEFLKAIRDKKSFVIGKEAGMHKKAIPKINIVRKHLNNVPHYVRKKIKKYRNNK